MLKVRKSATQQAAEVIQERIHAGEYGIGQALPGQRQLAEELGMGRPAVREAISALAGLGLVRIEVGRGVYVNDPATVQGWRFASRYALEEVYAVRAALEVLSVRLVTAHADAQALNNLDLFVDELEDAVARRDLLAMSHADRGFHRRLAELSGNALLQEMLDTFDQVITESKNIAFLDPFGAGHLAAVVAEHRAIVNAIKARDAETACTNMRQHIASAEERAQRVNKKDT